MSENSLKNISSCLLTSVSTLSDVALTAPIRSIVHSNRAPSENLISPKQIVLCNQLSAEKRSSEVALGQLQITSQAELKRVHHNLVGVERERDELVSHVRRLKVKLEEADTELARCRQELRNYKLEAQLRVDALLKTYKHDQTNVEKIDELEAELVKVKTQLVETKSEIFRLTSITDETKIALELSERKYAELKILHEEKQTSFDEVPNLRKQILELQTANKSLVDRMEQAIHGPGNASSFIPRPDGSGLLHSSSLLQTTRLQQRITRLETENAEAHRRQAELVCLQDEVLDLREKLERAKEWRERALLAEEKLEAMVAVGQENNPHNKVEDSVGLAQVQRENALFLAEQGQLRSQLHRNDAELSAAHEQLAKLSENLARVEASLQCAELRIRRQDRKLVIIRQERDMYKRFVESYEDADATLHSPSGDLVSQFQSMVTTIRSSLDVFESEVAKEDVELERLRSVVSTLASSAAIAHSSQIDSKNESAMSTADHSTILELRQTIAELEKQCETLNAANTKIQFEVECMRARGAFNPDETQVLHMGANPIDEAKRCANDELISLRKENALLVQRSKVLQERLSRVYENKSGNSNVTMLANEFLKDHPDPLSEIQKLKSKLQAEKWRGDRLMDTFATASSEFREACGLLFGYNLHVRQPGFYRVQLRPTTAVSSSNGGYIKFKRSGDVLEIVDRTLRGDDEVERLFTSGPLPIPFLLARLILASTFSSDQSTMMM